MDKLRQKAREALQRDPWNRPDILQEAMMAAAQNNLHQLWKDVSTHDNSTHLDVSVYAIDSQKSNSDRLEQACESIYAAFSFIDCGWDPLLPNDAAPRELKGDEAQAVANLFHWASALALPSSEFAAAFDENAEVTEGMFTQEQSPRSPLTVHRNRKGAGRNSSSIHTGSIPHSYARDKGHNWPFRSFGGQLPRCDPGDGHLHLGT